MTLFDEIWGLAGYVENIVLFFGGLIFGIFGFISNVWGIVSLMISLLPPEMAALLITGLVIVGGYTVYSWIKDIEIGGFKI